AVANGDRVVWMDRDLDRVVVARQRLVDGVVDDLADEVVEAPDPGRADVHAGAEPDGLQALEHGDVLGRVSGLRLGLRHNQEKPAKRAFCQAHKLYQTGRSRRSRARLNLTAFCTLSRTFSSSIAEASARASSSSSGVGSRASTCRSSSGSGSGPGANRSFPTPSRSAISPARWPSSNDQIESAVFTWTVPSLAIRAGHALRAIAAPTAAGQRSTTSAIPACGPKRASSDLISLPSGSILHLHDLRRVGWERRRMCRCDHRLPHTRDPLCEHTAPAKVELREYVVEQEQRRRVEQLCLREQQREHRQPLLALRAELAQVEIAARDQHVVEMRTETGRPTLEVAGKPRVELGDGR